MALAFGFALVPTIDPLFGRAIAFAGVADSTGENDIGGFMSATLIDGDDVIDGELIGIVLPLAVEADTCLLDADSGLALAP